MLNNKPLAAENNVVDAVPLVAESEANANVVGTVVITSSTVASPLTTTTSSCTAMDRQWAIGWTWIALAVDAFVLLVTSGSLCHRLGSSP